MKAIEICAGAGGQALGLEQAGFEHLALIEIDHDACNTLRINRPKWNVIEGDVVTFSAIKFTEIDLLAGGVPCPPFSVAGKQFGSLDERDLFPHALRLVNECNPKAVLLENVRGLFDPKFERYRNGIVEKLDSFGYTAFWDIINASHFGVPQLRPRSILVALKYEYAKHFAWPTGDPAKPPTVGEMLYPYMAADGWEGAGDWMKKANDIAPTIVGGSKKHGGPDLGPTRARLAWEKLGVNGKSLTDKPPQIGFAGNPKLTVQMAAVIQGFPHSWKFSGNKTTTYKQVGNAFPPPVAKAVGEAIIQALRTEIIPGHQANKLSVQHHLFSDDTTLPAIQMFK
jgi:DNA (cytosine-5)-methyltransferase 1